MDVCTTDAPEELLWAECTILTIEDAERDRHAGVDVVARAQRHAMIGTIALGADGLERGTDPAVRIEQQQAGSGVRECGFELHTLVLFGLRRVVEEHVHAAALERGQEHVVCRADDPPPASACRLANSASSTGEQVEGQQFTRAAFPPVALECVQQDERPETEVDPGLDHHLRLACTHHQIPNETVAERRAAPDVQPPAKMASQELIELGGSLSLGGLAGELARWLPERSRKPVDHLRRVLHPVGEALDLGVKEHVRHSAAMTDIRVVAAHLTVLRKPPQPAQATRTKMPSGADVVLDCLDHRRTHANEVLGRTAQAKYGRSGSHPQRDSSTSVSRLQRT